jgi:hypothetical protein
MPTLRVALLASLALTVPAAAHASVDRTHFAEQAAFAYWHQLPCDGRIDMRLGWVAPGDAANTYLYYRASVPTCHITISRAFFGARSRVGYPAFCATVVHEFGHALGFTEKGGPDNGLHSANPRNVMYPTVSRENTPAVCLRSSGRSSARTPPSRTALPR